jgi:3-dehydroquinate dehydratase-2
MLDIPIIEVHLSNIYKRESFRHTSYVADVAAARIAGFGKEGYMMAVEAVTRMIAK